MALHESQDPGLRRPPPADPRLREDLADDVAARGTGVGVPQEAGQVAVPECPLRLVPGGLPLRRRDLCAPGVTGSLREDGPGYRRRLHLLAPGPRHAARVAVVPEPQRVLRQLQPARQAVQRGVSPGTDRIGRTTRPMRSAGPRRHTTSAATWVCA